MPNFLSNSLTKDTARARLSMQKAMSASTDMLRTITIIALSTLASACVSAGGGGYSQSSSLAHETTRGRTVVYSPDANCPIIASDFGSHLEPDGTTSREGNKHTGIDIIVPVGTNVLATDNGVIAKIFNGDTGGYHVIVQHDYTAFQLFSIYAHLSQGSAMFNEGDTVKAGDVIAKSGQTGKSKTAHLHLAIIYSDTDEIEMRRGGTYAWFPRGEKTNPHNRWKFGLKDTPDSKQIPYFTADPNNPGKYSLGEEFVGQGIVYPIACEKVDKTK